MRKDKYTIKDLKRDFPNDEVCLEFMFDALHSEECSCGGTYKKIKERKQYQCSKCRFQIAPTAGTIFHKSSTSLTDWFHAIWVFSNAKSGVSAKEMERQLGVTYKCAWRILKNIREALSQHTNKLSGDVEMDTGYFGGRQRAGKDNVNLSAAMAKKGVVMAAVERGGNMKAKVVADSTAKSHGDFLQESVELGSRLLTDGTNRLDKVAVGYDRHSVNHSKKEWARGDVYIASAERFFGHAKRSIKGTHKVISRKYLQSYLDGFVFHYNNRHNDKERFAVLLGALIHA